VSVDNESIAATTYESKISALKSQVREIKVERDSLKGDYQTVSEKLWEVAKERDRLKEDLKLQAKSYDANSKGWQKDIKQLRARHAALVEKYNELLDV